VTRLRFDSSPPPKKPVRRVARATKNWGGFCPACGRGADGFGGWIWCDCGAREFCAAERRADRGGA
jgi:hypothetical protein